MLLLDLLSRSPKSIKIFNSTVYYPIGSKLYDVHQKSLWRKISSIVNAFGTHDVISEYLIMRNLFYLRLIKVDENLKYVLTLKIDKFLNNMEKFYKPLF